MNKIKEYRTREGLTQQALADAVGVPRQRINEWENDKFAPSLASRRKLAKVLNIKQVELCAP